MRLSAEMGASIRIIRQSKKITAKQIAQRIGVTEAAMTAYERGERKIPVERLIAICKILGITIEDLYQERGIEDVVSQV